VSEANESTTVSEANDSTTVSEANDSRTVSEANDSTSPGEHHPHLHIVKGQPTPEDLAALVAVIAAQREQAVQESDEHDLWGHPVDQLRYTATSWQHVSLNQRTHMRQ
jgi:hypothetical protein